MTQIIATVPSMSAIYRRALLSRKSPERSGFQSSQGLPALSYAVQGMQIDRSRLQRYNAVCGFDESHGIAATFPQVMAFPLQLVMMTDKQFPLPLLGMVHVRNSIQMFRPFSPDEHFDLEVTLGGQQQVEKGIEFDIDSTICVGQETVWRASATMLHRCSTGIEKQAKQQKPAPLMGNISEWQLPANLGRRFARASGDVNPIHLFWLSARLFGFKQAIIHGMWTKAHCLACLNGQLPPQPFEVSTRFKLPVLLPNRVRFSYQKQVGGVDFEVWDWQSNKPHLSGQVRIL